MIFNLLLETTVHEYDDAFFDHQSYFSIAILKMFLQQLPKYGLQWTEF